MNVSSRRRLVVLYVLAAAMLISLGGRLYYLQVLNNTSFTKLAEQNQTRDVIVPAVRGQILDDVGNQLVTNQTALVVSVDMMTLNQQPGGATPVLKRLAPLLGMSYTKLSDETRLCTKGVPQPCWAGLSRTSPSRWTSTSPIRWRCRSWRSRRNSPASPRRFSRSSSTPSPTGPTRRRSWATCSRSPRRRSPAGTCR